ASKIRPFTTSRTFFSVLLTQMILACPRHWGGSLITAPAVPASASANTTETIAAIFTFNPFAWRSGGHAEIILYYVNKWWARWDLNPQGLFSQRILSPSRIPIPPLALVKASASTFHFYINIKV